MDSKAEKVVKNLSNIIFDLRAENESLYDTVKIYSKRIDELRKENEHLRTELNSTKSRVERAIEYVKTWVCDEYSIAIRDPNDKRFCSNEPNAVDNLLNILQNGSDNNGKW